VSSDVDARFVKMMLAKVGETISGGTRTIPAFVLDPDDISIFIDLRKYLPGILLERLQLRLGVLEEIVVSLKACGREPEKRGNPMRLYQEKVSRPSNSSQSYEWSNY
jgi:hypothetical protein